MELERVLTRKGASPSGCKHSPSLPNWLIVPWYSWQGMFPVVGFVPPEHGVRARDCQGAGPGEGRKLHRCLGPWLRELGLSKGAWGSGAISSLEPLTTVGELKRKSLQRSFVVLRIEWIGGTWYSKFS